MPQKIQLRRDTLANFIANAVILSEGEPAYCTNDKSYRIGDGITAFAELMVLSEQGEQGLQGIQGVKGDKGDTGAQGAQGIQGLAGNLPVGAIYLTTVATNPNTVLGYGTWAAFGVGKVLVGVDVSQAEFDSVEKTGGEKTHALTNGEMPSHTHTQNAHTHIQDTHSHIQNASITGIGSAFNHTSLVANNANVASTTDTLESTNTTIATNQNTVATNNNTGGGAGHNNLQPYITCYMFKRTA